MLLYDFLYTAKPLFSGSNPDAASIFYPPPTRKIRAAAHVAQLVKFILTHPTILMIPDGNMTGIMTQHNGRWILQLDFKRRQPWERITLFS